MRVFAAPHLLAEAVGERLGASGWRAVTQRMVDDFAALTGDHQWIHTDPRRAATGPFGATIAHGFLVASLLPSMLDEVVAVRECAVVLNRGVDRLRFDAPVLAGARIRAHIEVASVRSRPRGFVECSFGVGVQVERPGHTACSAQLRYLYQAPGHQVASGVGGCRPPGRVGPRGPISRAARGGRPGAPGPDPG